LKGKQEENQRHAKPIIEKIAKERYDCVSLALKDTKAILAERIAEVEILSSKLATMQSELTTTKADMKHLVKVMARLTNPE